MSKNKTPGSKSTRTKQSDGKSVAGKKRRRDKKPRKEEAGQPDGRKTGAERRSRKAHARRSNKPKGEKKVGGGSSLEDRVVEQVGKEPLDAAALANRLQLDGREREDLRGLLRRLEREGRVARIRRDRYILPKEADLYTGEIQIHPSGSAHVLAKPGEGPDIFVSAENTITAMHGDTVVVRIFPDKDRKKETGRREGRVIRVVERVNDRIVGTLQKTRNFLFVVADDPRFVHNLYVPEPTGDLKAKPGDKVVAKMEAWESRHVNPEGILTEVLGPADAPGVDMLAIIRKHRLPEEFPAGVLRAAEGLSSQDPAGEAGRREDRREDAVFTIDPDDARDFDDAIWVREHKDHWEFAVHIADVSHYVQPGSALDREAKARGNSVYLPDRVIPMLPEVLSNGLCSLRPDEDRLAFTVFAKVNFKGKTRSTRFAKTLIRSRQRLTYKKALRILEKERAENGMEENIRTAWKLAEVLRKRRFQRGSLDLDFPETKVILDENGKPIRIEKVENDISHQLIEELMLFANEAVAREMRIRKQPTIYRVHEPPDEDRLLEFRETALVYVPSCGDLSNRAELQKLLAGVRGKQWEYGVKLALLKSLKRARYSEQPIGHYGLSKSDYLHFTSPIRRYADLVAHRALEKYLGITSDGPDSRELPAVAEHISTTERTASDAEREAQKMKKLEFFNEQIRTRKGESFPARIVEVRNYGLLVELPDFLVTGLIHISAIEGDFFVYDAARSRLRGRKTGVVFSIGQELDVVVSKVDLFKQQVDFAPA